MRTLFLALLIGILSFSFVVTDAQAKRFGGGKSFGSSRQAAAPSHANRGANQAQKPASGASKWLGPLAGLALGGLLATLFMGHGFGSGMLLWLGIAVAAFFIWRLIRSKLPPPNSTASNYNFQAQPAGNFTDKFTAPRFPAQTNSLQPVPTSFDESGFLRQAKALFIRLQADYDSKNLADIREFTTPEVFAEVQLQLQERGNETNVTEVVDINAQLVDCDEAAKTASVLFSGYIREQQNAEPVYVKEQWHFQKNMFNSNWIVAGIQQEDEEFN